MTNGFIKILDWDWLNYRELDLFGFMVILGLIVLIVVLRKATRKGPIEFPDKDYSDLQNYTFNFTQDGDSIYSEPKKHVSLFAKIILILIIIALILLPIGHFIPAFDLWW